MRKALLAAVLLGAALLPTTQAQAHGSCTATAGWTHNSAGSQWRGDGYVACNTNHDKTWVLVEVQRRPFGGTWNTIWSTADSCSDCHSDSTSTLYHSLCTNYEWRVHATGWQVSGSGSQHNQDIDNSPVKTGDGVC